jgi:hypothetical protein
MVLVQRLKTCLVADEALSKDWPWITGQQPLDVSSRPDAGSYLTRARVGNIFGPERGHGYGTEQFIISADPKSLYGG